MSLVNLMMLYLNRQERSKGIPEELKDFYNKIQYNKWLNYKNDTDQFIIVKTIINIIICMIYLLSPIYSYISKLFPSNILINSICMLIVISIFETIISSIEDYYRNFVIEEKFNMNKMTKKTFLIDTIKDFILDLLLMIILFIFVHFFYQWFSYVGFIILFIVLAIIISIIQRNSLFILKIYNKFTDIEDGELKDKLISLVEKHGFKLKGIYVMDASKRTKRANAFCLGNGKKKEICIDDNMFNQYSDDEIIAVFAHELGHAVYKHGNKLKWLTYLNIVILYMTFIFILLNPSIYSQYIVNTNYYMVMFITGILVEPIAFLLNIPASYYSRKCEYEADSFANKEGYGEHLVNILKKLTRNDLSDVMPHPLVVKLTYSHPTLLQRIHNIKGEDR
jgi:STE24 endopeptidase